MERLLGGAMRGNHVEGPRELPETAQAFVKGCGSCPWWGLALPRFAGDICHGAVMAGEEPGRSTHACPGSPGHCLSSSDVQRSSAGTGRRLCYRHALGNASVQVKEPGSGAVRLGSRPRAPQEHFPRPLVCSAVHRLSIGFSLMISIASSPSRVGTVRGAVSQALVGGTCQGLCWASPVLWGTWTQGFRSLGFLVTLWPASGRRVPQYGSWGQECVSLVEALDRVSPGLLSCLCGSSVRRGQLCPKVIPELSVLRTAGAAGGVRQGGTLCLGHGEPTHRLLWPLCEALPRAVVPSRAPWGLAFLFGLHGRACRRGWEAAEDGSCPSHSLGLSPPSLTLSVSTHLPTISGWGWPGRRLPVGSMLMTDRDPGPGQPDFVSFSSRSASAGGLKWTHANPRWTSAEREQQGCCNKLNEYLHPTCGSSS
ncbi:uncharacterized protein LOC112676390 isoform X2 [Canis lupus dingo]|uniref:uncharacterized protein LOC112676390 isoform X2 n=1 Tax=Canis lupus dingo TaxID=286419 RepID=UPI0020C5641C|nr:uncharacterized protein LOC112676390 isoform X2 [Canis lupus dingo]XP_048958171.1 uncharacterized protein LOC112676390 isoform X2 [Canis lupus dingo]